MPTQFPDQQRIDAPVNTASLGIGDGYYTYKVSLVKEFPRIGRVGRIRLYQLSESTHPTRLLGETVCCRLTREGEYNYLHQPKWIEVYRGNPRSRQVSGERTLAFAGEEILDEINALIGSNWAPAPAWVKDDTNEERRGHIYRWCAESVAVIRVVHGSEIIESQVQSLLLCRHADSAYLAPQTWTSCKFAEASLLGVSNETLAALAPLLDSQ